MTDPFKQDGDDSTNLQNSKEGVTDETFTSGDSQVQGPEVSGLAPEDLQKIVNRDHHAQQHIKRLEQETAQYRTMLKDYEDKMNETLNYREMMERIRTQNSTTGNEQTANFASVDELVPAVEQRVLESLSARERERVETENLNKALSSLQTTYGDKYKDVVNRKASELGLPVEEMTKLAKTSPSALIELMKGNTTSSAAHSHSSTNTNVASTQHQENMDYFNKVRKEDPRTFYSQEFQGKYNRAILDKANKERVAKGLPPL